MSGLKSKLDDTSATAKPQSHEPANHRHLRLIDAPQEDQSLGKIRHPEIDAFRGLAVALMVVFHGLFNLKLFASHQSLKLTWMPQLYWDYMSEVIGVMFFLTVGVSAKLKLQKLSLTQTPYRVFLQQGVKLGLIAGAITLATGIFIPRMTVYFGTIHCIATVTFIIYPFLRHSPTTNFMLGLPIAILGFIMRDYKVSTAWLLWFGFPPSSGQTGGDWYPLMPWFGVALLGVGFGTWLSENSFLPTTLHKLRKVIQDHTSFKILVWLGRHSLAIYLIHQPAFIAGYLLLELIRFQ